MHDSPPPDAARTPWYQKLPAKLAAAVVFLVALTTLIGNVLDLFGARTSDAPPQAPSPATTATAASAPSAAPAPAPQHLELRLDRIVVRRDGSIGTTDWRFAVEADGQPLLVLSQDDLDDVGGRNVALPRDIATRLRLAEGAVVPLAIKGWRGSRLRLPTAAPDATGEGVLAGPGALAPIAVSAEDAADGDFVFHFSAGRLE